jgi:hypothetical protein
MSQLALENKRLAAIKDTLHGHLKRLQKSRFAEPTPLPAVDTSGTHSRSVVSYEDLSATRTATPAPVHKQFGSSSNIERPASSVQGAMIKPQGNTGDPVGSPNVVSMSIRGIGHQIPASAPRTVMSIAGRSRDSVCPSLLRCPSRSSHLFS